MAVSVNNPTSSALNQFTDTKRLYALERRRVGIRAESNAKTKDEHQHRHHGNHTLCIAFHTISQPQYEWQDAEAEKHNGCSYKRANSYT